MRSTRAAARDIGAAAVAILAVGLALSALLRVSGYNAGASLEALWRGSLGSGYSFVSGTLVRAVPLMMSGLAVAVAFRVGVINIGVEGQFLAGAATAAAIALSFPAGGIVMMLVVIACGAAGGALWASVAALLKHRLSVL